jgi:drug/metabolite transporter (DMT)-like permease
MDRIESSRREQLVAQAVLIGAMAVWGVNVSAVKVLAGTLDMMAVATSRMVVAVAALTVALVVMRQARLPIRLKALGGLVCCAVLMVYANQMLFAAAISRTSATHCAMLNALSPLISSLIASTLLHERLGAARIVGIAVGLAGVAMVILTRQGASASGDLVGDLLMMAAVTCFATGGALIQRLSAGLSALQISWFIHVVGTLMLLVHAAIGAPTTFDAVVGASTNDWGLILFSGVCATALAAIAWNSAIARIGVARTAMAFYWVPIFGLAFAALALGEPLTFWHPLGLACVIVGSLLARARQRPSSAMSPSEG